MGFDLFRVGKLDEVNAISEQWKTQQGANISTSADPVEFLNTYFRMAEDSGLYFRWNVSNWRALAPLLTDFGWQPKHELKHYISNMGNIVNREDAHNLAAAGKVAVIDERIRALENEWLQDKLSRFAEFCRGGEFEIH